MHSTPSSNPPPALASILDDPAPVTIAAPRAPSRRALTPAQRTLVRRVGSLGALTLLLTAGLWGIFALAPRSEPDYLSDDMGNLLDYTFLGDEFNNLPIERRMELLKELVKRFKTLSTDDPVAMADFAASLKRDLRKQMERNIKRLAVDTIDIYARDYTQVPPGEQDDFLDKAIIGFTDMMEDVTDEHRMFPDNESERLAAIKDQAKKDEKRLRDGDSRPTARRVARFFEFIHNDQENISDPVQRGRNARFVRDMTRHLRGQDLATGKPVDGPR